MTRTARLLASVALAALTLTGCGDGTGPSGAAATVGDTKITVSSLDALVERSLKDPNAQQQLGADKATFTRAALKRMISHQIDLAAAKQEGITLTNGDIDQTLDRFARDYGTLDDLKAQTLKSGISAQDLRQEVGDVAIRDLLSDKLTADIPVTEAQLQAAYTADIAKFDRVHSAHILVPTEAKANALLAQVKADPSKFAELAAANSTDTGSKDKGGDLGFQGRGALVKPFEDAIFNNPPGSYVVVKTEFGYHVIHVIERKTTTFDQAKVELRRNVLGQARDTAVSAFLVKFASKVGVKVNPRFGTWDPKALTVVALPDCKASAVATRSPRPDDAAPAAAPTASATPGPSC